MKMSRIIVLSLSLVLVYSIGMTQTVTLNVSEESTMSVTGSSTLHDWTSEVNTITGTAEMGKKMVEKGKVKKGSEIKSVKIIVPVKSIISPRGATMDKKAYNALKSEEHPNIIFELSDNVVSSVSENGFSVAANGDLTIAGKKNHVEFPVEGKIISSDKVSFIGSYKLNMKDYDMEPPSAMFGQIVTGEEIEIKFELIVSK